MSGGGGKPTAIEASADRGSGGAAWIRFWAPSEPAVDAAALSSALLAAGIDLVDVDAVASDRPGIIVVGSVTSDVLDDLRRVSRNGLGRVIVLCDIVSEPAGGDAVWRLLDAGASDVLPCPHVPSQFREIAARLTRWAEIERLLDSPAVQNNLIGRSRAWTTMLRELIEVARFGDGAILITGESGTGKELVARLVHTLDPRPDKADLVVVDCTTLARELAGSELFGHEKGSYTGAAGAREGAIALANGGTLFLDEVGELALPLQAQLLRVVQERMYKRVGGNTWHSSQFRLVSATNRDLSAEMTTGGFRTDLYYRLATWTCRTPPLRERPEDILPLVEHFVRAFLPGSAHTLDTSVRDYLLSREYPGNVRELRQVVQRICARHVGNGPLSVGDVAMHERPVLPRTCDWQGGPLEHGVRRALSQGAGMREIGRVAEDLAVQIAVGEERGNLQRAAHRLGVTDRALQLRRAEQRR